MRLSADNYFYVCLASSGITETKIFTGETKLVDETISDTAYIGKKYYKPFDSDIEFNSIRLWLDDQIATNNETTGAQLMVVEYATSTAALWMAPPR